jgi:probable HAF family extracellular repeat protein
LDDGVSGNGINANDVVVGWGDSGDTHTFIRAFRWTQGAVPPFTVLNGLSGWTTTTAQAIDSSGRLVGYGLSPAGYYRAMGWDAANSPQNFQTLIGDSASGSSYAYGINSSGRIVGKSVSSGGPFHAFRTSDFVPIRAVVDDLGTFPGGTTSEAYAINDVGGGEVVGRATKSDGLWHAFLTKPGKKIDETGTADDAEDLGFLATGTSSVAFAINNGGLAVGYSFTSGGGPACLPVFPGQATDD